MSANTRLYVKKLTLSAMFLALGLVLPLLTGQLHSLGNMLLPMHLPVLLCGLICGWQVFLTADFVEAVPGILFQVLLIPVIMVALTRAGLVPLTARDAVDHKA